MDATPARRARRLAVGAGGALSLALAVVAHAGGLGEREARRLDAADRLLGVAGVEAPPGRFGEADDLPLPALLAAGSALLPLPDPLGARLGSILALALAVGLLAGAGAARLEREGARAPWLAAAATLACLLGWPTALGLSVLVGPDPLLAALTLGAAVACAAPAGGAASLAAGAAALLAPLAGTEGLLLGPSLLVLAAARQRWDLLRAVMIGLGVGVALWALLAGRTPGGPFLGPPDELGTYFLGVRRVGPPPATSWLPTLLVATTPPGVLLALGVGLVGAALRARRGCELAGALLAVSAGWLIAACLPRTPRGADLLGQLPLLASLAAAAGLGLAELAGARGRVAVWVALLVPATGLAAVLEAHPRPRCWRSPLVGGPLEAERMGLEPAPDLSVVARDVRAWLGEALPPGATLSSGGTAWVATLARRGLLRPDLRPSGRSDFVLLVNRPSRLAPETLTALEPQVVRRVEVRGALLLLVVQRGDR